MRRTLALLAAASTVALAGPALAQSAGQQAGMRYLSWNDRPQPTPTAAPADQPPARDGMRRPNMVIPHGGFSQAEPQRQALTPSPNARQGGLTPANAWLHGRGAAPAQPQPQPVARALPQPPAPAPAAAPRAEEEVAYAAPPANQIEAPRELTPPNYPDYMPGRGYRQYTPGETIMPVRPEAAPVYHQEDNQPARPQTAPHGEGQPTFQPQAYQAPQPMQPAPQAAPQQAPQQADPGYDPMAPRRDALIFRLQPQQQAEAAPAPAAPQPQPQPQAPAPQATRETAPQPRRVAMVTPNTADRPVRDQGARYYSVHRQNGQRPDGVAMPEPTYIDALAVNLTETPASQDLAAPEPGPTLIRDNQGRLRTAPAASNGDHQ